MSPRATAPPPPAGPGGLDRFCEQHGLRLVAAIALLHALLFSAIAFVKFRYYLFNDFDLAIFVQAVDGILRGTLYGSIRGMNWLGDHSSLVLFVLAPVYALARHPLTLPVLQSAAVAAGALPVFWLARRELGCAVAGVIFAVAYLAYPALAYAELYEFHPEVLATGPLLFSFYFLRAGRLGPAALFAGIALLCREDVGLVVVAMGLYALLLRRPRRWIHAAILVGLGAAALVLSFAVIKPALSGGEAEYAAMYRAWGGTMGEALVAMLRDPLRVATTLIATPTSSFDTEVKLLYHLHLLLPLLLLPLASPATLAIALPVLAEHLLASRVEQHTIFFQYTALITPFMVAAAVIGLRNLLELLPAPGRAVPLARRIEREPRLHRLLHLPAAAVLLAALACNLMFGAFTGLEILQKFRIVQRIVPADEDLTLAPYRDRMVARADRTGGAAATFEFLARLASRPDVHSLHHVMGGLYTYSTKPYPVPAGIVTLVGDVGDPRLQPYVDPGTGERMERLVAVNRLRPADSANDLLLLRADEPRPVELLETGAFESPLEPPVVYEGMLAFLGGELAELQAEQGGILTFRTFWRRAAPAERLFLTEFVVTDAAGRTALARTRFLGYTLHPVHRWPEDTTVRETYRLVIPRRLAPGTYDLSMRVRWRRAGEEGMARADHPSLASPGQVIALGRFEVRERGAR